MSIKELVIDHIPKFLEDVHIMTEQLKNNTIVTDTNIQNKLVILYKLMQFYSKCKETHKEPKFDMPEIESDSSSGTSDADDDGNYFVEDDDEDDVDDGEDIENLDSQSGSDIESEYEFNDVDVIQKEDVRRQLEIALVGLHICRNDVVTSTKN